MKLIFTALSFLYCAASFCQQTQKNISIPDKSKPIQVVEVGCGECKLGLKGKSCDLAVRINGQSYFVDGADIDSFGDAHSKEGFCNAIRKAEVQGEIINGRYNITYIKVLSKNDINISSKRRKQKKS